MLALKRIRGLADVNAGMEIADALPLGNLLVYIGVLLLCAAICASKGNYRLLALGVVFPAFWVVGAVTRAKPGSLWARVRYTFLDQHSGEEEWRPG